MQLALPCAITICVAIFGSAIAPACHFCAFAPLLALISHRFSHFAALWIAAGCGCLLDLLSSEYRLGLNALTYSLAMLCIYPQKHHFFEDKPVALALFAALISLLCTFLQRIFIPLFGVSLSWSWASLGTDCLLMPAIDALYAYLLIYYPMQVYHSRTQPQLPSS